MHWRDRMGIAQKEVKIKSAFKLLALLYILGRFTSAIAVQ